MTPDQERGGREARRYFRASPRRGGRVRHDGALGLAVVRREAPATGQARGLHEGGFLGSLGISLCVVYASGLGLAWFGLAVASSFSNAFFELFSPRGTDDFTMASANSLLCRGFGRFVL